MPAKDNPTPRPLTTEPELTSSLAFSLVAHTSDFIGVLDEDGVARFMNRSVRGADPSEVEGKPLEHFLSPERAQRIREMVREVRASGKPMIDDAVRIDALDGSERWFIEKCIPVREADGQLRFMLVRTETTHLRRAEDDLRASEALYRTLFESNPDPVVVVDVATLVIRTANPAAVRLYGFDEHELRKTEWLSLFHAEEREALRATYLSNPAGERRSGPQTWQPPSGTPAIAHIVGRPWTYSPASISPAPIAGIDHAIRSSMAVSRCRVRHAKRCT